jgi:hypothetical protein
VITIGEIITDPDFSQRFVVVRSTGSWIKGLWTEGSVTNVTMTGTVTNPTPRDLDQVDVADRVQGTMVFHSREPLYVTRAGAGTKKDPNAISDKIIWRGEYYKLSGVSVYADYGYYSAVGVRIKGD